MVKELLQSYGYQKEDIDLIINIYPLNCYKEKDLIIKIESIYKLFLELGYTKEEIIHFVFKTFKGLKRRYWLSIS